MNGKYIAILVKYALDKGLNVNKIVSETLTLLKTHKFESKARKRKVLDEICDCLTIGVNL